jgi:hypothetical protein
MRIAFALFLMVGLAACAPVPGNEWQRADGSGPDVGDTSQCRSEARWQARNRNPPQVVRNQDGSAYRVSNPDMFPAEMRFFRMCMNRLGYERSASS